jgi:hypothetical protein
MRMSSDMFPFASHSKYGYDLSFADKDLKVPLFLLTRLPYPLMNLLTGNRLAASSRKSMGIDLPHILARFVVSVH